MPLIGERELFARLDAIAKVERPTGVAWAEAAAKYARGHVPVRTGELQRSIHPTTINDSRHGVSSAATIAFVDPGSRAHDEEPRDKQVMAFEAKNRTIFAKRVHHPATRGRSIRRNAAKAGLAGDPYGTAIVKLWNGAA